MSFADERTWLDCYYGAAQPLRAKLGLPPAPNSQQVLVPTAGPGAPAYAPAYTPAAPAYAPAQTSNSQPNKQGFFTRLISPTTEKPEPPTHMTSYKFDNAGFFTVTLANGETWRQSSGDAVQAKWRNQAASYAVQIEPGQTLNEKKMHVGRDEIYQVERVQ